MTIFSDFPASTAPTARGIEAFVRDRIESGQLVEGARLPPIRDAAWALGCAPGTVARAYRALVVADLAQGEVGRGTYIGATRDPAVFPTFVSGMGPGGAPIVDLSVNLFRMIDPGPIVSEALKRATSELPGFGDYDCAGGDRRDRIEALRILDRWRPGVVPEDVVVTGGGQSGLLSAMLALREAGAIACDALTYPGVLTAARAAGLRLQPIAMDAEGMCPLALEAMAERGGLGSVVLMPSVQNPTGGMMSQQRVAALAEIVERHALTVIEDQAYGFLRDPVSVTFCAYIPERTVLIETLSKSVSPVLRTGYVVATPLMARRIAAVQNAMHLMVSPVLARASSWVVAQNAFDKRLEDLRIGVARRADLVARRLPGIERDKLSGGLAWMTLDAAWHADGTGWALRLLDVHDGRSARRGRYPYLRGVAAFFGCRR